MEFICKKPSFLGPLRLPELVDPVDLPTTPEVDEAIKAYSSALNKSVPVGLLPVLLGRALALYLTEDCTSAVSFLSAHSSADDVLSKKLLGLNDTEQTPKCLKILDCLLYPSKDAFILMLESKSPIFQVSSDNSHFPGLFWEGCVALGKTEEYRQALSRLFPLVVFVTRCSEELFGFSRDVARFAFLFEHRSRYQEYMSKLLTELNNSNASREQRASVGAELAHFVQCPDLLQSLVDNGVFEPEFRLSPIPLEFDSQFIDMMTPYMTIAYAGAPDWAYRIVCSLQEFCSILEEDKVDTVIGNLCYRGCALTEPYHLARRLVTLLLYLADKQECNIKRGFVRFMGNKSTAIYSQESVKTHNRTISKVFEGLEAVELFGVVSQATVELTKKVFSSEIPMATQTQKKIISEIISEVHDNNKVLSSAPYTPVPLSNITLIEPSTRSELYSSLSLELSSSSLTDRYKLVENMLDPEEDYILGSSKPLCLFFSENDVSKCSDSVRCILLN